MEAGKRLRMVKPAEEAYWRIEKPSAASTKSRFSLKVLPSDVNNADYAVLSVAGRQLDFDFTDLDGGLDVRVIGNVSDNLCRVWAKRRLKGIHGFEIEMAHGKKGCG